MDWVGRTFEGPGLDAEGWWIPTPMSWGSGIRPPGPYPRLLPENEPEKRTRHVCNVVGTFFETAFPPRHGKIRHGAP